MTDDMIERVRKAFEMREWYYKQRKVVKKRIKKKVKVQVEEAVTEEEQVKQLMQQNGPTHTYDFNGKQLRIQAVDEDLLPSNLGRSKFSIRN